MGVGTENRCKIWGKDQQDPPPPFIPKIKSELDLQKMRKNRSRNRADVNKSAPDPLLCVGN